MCFLHVFIHNYSSISKYKTERTNISSNYSPLLFSVCVCVYFNKNKCGENIEFKRYIYIYITGGFLNREGGVIQEAILVIQITVAVCEESDHN